MSKFFYQPKSEKPPCNADCLCPVCSGKKTIDEVRKMEEELAKKYGWFYHAIVDEQQKPMGCDIHTHGLRQEFQIVFPFPLIMPLDKAKEIVHNILHTFADRLKKGETFFDGQLVTEVIKNFPVKLIAINNGFRIIFPDKDGNIEKEEMDGIYAGQYDTGEDDGL